MLSKIITTLRKKSVFADTSTLWHRHLSTWLLAATGTTHLLLVIHTSSLFFGEETLQIAVLTSLYICAIMFGLRLSHVHQKKVSFVQSGGIINTIRYLLGSVGIMVILSQFLYTNSTILTSLLLYVLTTVLGLLYGWILNTFSDFFHTEFHSPRENFFLQIGFGTLIGSILYALLYTNMPFIPVIVAIITILGALSALILSAHIPKKSPRLTSFHIVLVGLSLALLFII